MNKESTVVNLILVRLFLKNTSYNYEKNPNRSDILKFYKEYSPEDWKVFLKEKRDLWLNHSLPSLTAQTNQDFDCLVFIDPTFPEYSCIQEDIEANTHLFEIIYTDMPWGDGAPCTSWETFVHPMQKAVKEYVKEKYPKCKWLTTQRLDSDDLICNDFMEKVAGTFDEIERWVIFKNGYVGIKDPNAKAIKIYHVTDYGTMHHTYCEPFSEDIKTVYHRTHNKLAIVEGASDSLIIGEPKRSSWSKGYWLDLIGYDTNASRNQTRSQLGYTHYATASDIQIVDVKTNFTTNLGIEK